MELEFRNEAELKYFNLKPLLEREEYDENIHGIRPYYGAFNIY